MNEDRRKRQRTLSPECISTESTKSCKDGWVDQLKAAASLECSILTEKSNHQESKDKRASDVHKDGLNGAKRMNSRAGVDETPALFIHRDNNLDEKPGNGVAPAKPEAVATIPCRKMFSVVVDEKPAYTTTESISPEVTTLRVRSDGRLASSMTIRGSDGSRAPKSTLRVRPDGKLGSPVTKEVPRITKRKRSRKPTEVGSISEPLVVIVKYGADEMSRSVIGRNIEDILSSREVISSPAKAKPSRPAEPLKATHPFFLAGMAPCSDRMTSKFNDEKHEREADGDPFSQQSKAVSPMKARVISKPAEFVDNILGAIPLGRNKLGSDHARLPRFPGALNPIWPPLGMLHVGKEIETAGSTDLDEHRVAEARTSCRKLKGSEIVVPAEEEVLRPYLDLIHAYEVDQTISQKENPRDWRAFRRPLRRLMTGQSLQKAVNLRMSTNFSSSSPIPEVEERTDELSGPQFHQLQPHTALRQVSEQIATSRTAFDKFECETQDWVHKYAPKTAENVLQEGREAIILRDWLRGLTVTSTESSDNKNRVSSIPRKYDSRASKRKRKRAEELDGFVVSSDEEADQMDEITDPPDNNTPANPSLYKTTIRGGNDAACSRIYDRSANAVVISGPHGCGKTAAVYAAAQDLGFEVFEINAGSRRSGKDILDKVGDMTRNHLVKSASGDGAETPKVEIEASKGLSEQPKQLESKPKSTTNSFFKAKGPITRNSPGSKENAAKTSRQMKEAPRKHQTQKQSLILIEEVDVLFEEDKLFWATILDLITQSKRPIVLTCTDEGFLPLNEMVLYAILRLKSPPEQLAIDYLLLVACNEGHLLPRDAVSNLYKVKGSDLRASMAELNFFCQMAIGDSKGGLEWMLTEFPANDGDVDRTEPLRVVSDGTYQSFMGWLSGEVQAPQEGNLFGRETELLSEAWHGWGIDVGGSTQSLLEPVPTAEIHTSWTSKMSALRSFDQAAEALSAVDIFPACACRQHDHIILEPALPEITERTRSNYVESSNVLVADPLIEHSGTAESLSLTMRACANHLSRGSLHGNQILSQTDHEQFIARILSDIMQERRMGVPVIESILAAAFEPIARSTKSMLGILKGSQISSFDGLMSIIAEDIAPYVRDIVSYDLRLEEQRRQLDSLLSGRGKNGTKSRTTRSSRAALEGGQKAYTRRERWFPNNTNIDMVLQSGGSNWQGALQRMMMDKRGHATTSPDLDGSRESSVKSDL